MYATVAIIRALADELRRRGVRTPAFCREVGLRADELDDPTLLLPMGRYDALLRATRGLTGDDAEIGLRAGAAARAHAHRVGHLVSVCATLREAMAMLTRYRSLLLEAARFDLLEHGRVARFVFEHPAVARDNARIEAQVLLAVIVEVGRLFVPGRSPRRVRLAYARPARVDVHEGFFRCGLEFGAGAHQIEFDRHSLDVRNVHHDRPLCELLERAADRWLAERHEEKAWPRRVRDLLRYDVDIARRGPTHIARRLGLSPRGLQRRLRTQGVTLRELLDETRREAACAALADPATPVKEVSVRLGFSEPSAFHRAFKRWTGVTPGQYRHAHLLAQDDGSVALVERSR